MTLRRCSRVPHRACFVRAVFRGDAVLAQISQQELSGHGFKPASSVPFVGFSVPRTVGPHLALDTGAGIGGLSLLRQILSPRTRSWQPNSPRSSRR